MATAAKAASSAAATDLIEDVGAVGAGVRAAAGGVIVSPK